MQKFFINIYEQIKRLLCERRNKRAILNPYATLQKTQIVLRKPQTIILEQSQEQPIQIDLIKLDESVQQIATKPQSYVRALEQKCAYDYDTKYMQIEDLTQQQQTNAQYVIDLEKMIQDQIKFSNINQQFIDIYQKYRIVSQQDEKRKKNFWKNIYLNFQSYQDLLNDKEISDMLSQNQEFNKQVLDNNTLKITYKSDIIDVIQLKYRSEYIDYPQISFQKYCQIRNLWAVARKLQNEVIKNMKLKILQKLTYRSLRTLCFGVWLNDQIINAYLQLIQTKANQMGFQYKILNSFFAQTTFSKSNQLIERALKRKKINQTNKLVIAINNGVHWFFAQIRKSKIIIYDSIRKDAYYYLQSESTSTIFQNILKFSNWFYNVDHFLQVNNNYPQQSNSYDCGMFLLCGSGVFRNRILIIRGFRWQSNCWTRRQTVFIYEFNSNSNQNKQFIELQEKKRQKLIEQEIKYSGKDQDKYKKPKQKQGLLNLMRD